MAGIFKGPKIGGATTTAMGVVLKTLAITEKTFFFFLPHTYTKIKCDTKLHTSVVAHIGQPINTYIYLSNHVVIDLKTL